MNLRLTCPSCKSSEPNSFRQMSDFELVGYHSCVEWSDFTDHLPDLNEYHWQRASVYPVLNENRLLKVKHPFSCRTDDSFWSLFHPTNRTQHFWENNPYEAEPVTIEDSAFVQCKLIEVISCNQFAAWIKVAVLDIIDLSGAINKIQPVISKTKYNADFGMLVNQINFHFGDRQFHGWNGGGDIGAWSVSKSVNGKNHCVLFGTWDFHDNAAYLGNIVNPSD